MPGTVANRSKSGDSARLEHRLVLLSWLNEQLGYENTPQLLEDFKQAAEGFTPDGRSYVYLRLISREISPKISPEDLARYDDNIREHLYAMNAGRAEPPDQPAALHRQHHRVVAGADDPSRPQDVTSPATLEVGEGRGQQPPVRCCEFEAGRRGPQQGDVHLDGMLRASGSLPRNRGLLEGCRLSAVRDVEPQQ